ncbi:hypothetical protein [Schumannella luteola]
MARYAIDVTTALRLAREGIRVSAAHQLVAPNRLMSDALSELYRAVRGGADRTAALAQLDHLTTTKIRLLGDRVSRGTAFRVAEELGWADTAKAEYVSVARLQADALVSSDPDLAAAGVPIAPFEALLAD